MVTLAYCCISIYLQSLVWIFRLGFTQDLAVQIWCFRCISSFIRPQMLHPRMPFIIEKVFGMTPSPWLRLTMDIYPTGLSWVWWRYIIYVWWRRHSLRNGTYMSRALLLQLGLMWLWSNKYCHRVPRDDLQMVLAAWYLSLSLIFFLFFHPSSPSRLCLASWPWSMVSSAISSFVRVQMEDRWTGRAF